MTIAHGVHVIPAAEYHADPCVAPSLSASIATILMQSSPLHAKTAHPRLTENPVKEEARHLDLGQLCHSLMLEGADIAVVIEADNYRTKAAQEARDSARLAGKCPLLAHEMVEVNHMMMACRAQLTAHQTAGEAFTSAGKPEQTLIWQEPNGIWCRCRIDWLHASKPWIVDYKTGKRSAHPQSISRVAAASGWCIQDAFYRRGFKAVFGHDLEPEFFFVCQENFPPFALSVVETSPADLALAEAQVEYAIATWGECLKSGRWPGYATTVQRITSPSYVEASWLEREQEEV
jgi:hypothetical protein